MECADIGHHCCDDVARNTNFLDADFASLMRKVEVALLNAPRGVRIRGEQWVQRLALLSWVPQEHFRRDRNLHAELLLECIEESRWMEPLNRHPPHGPLPMLPPHVACSLRRRRQERLDMVRETSIALPEFSELPSNKEQVDRFPTERYRCEEGGNLKYVRKSDSHAKGLGKRADVEQEFEAGASSRSLAGVAAAAVSRIPKDVASAPPAYATLAARVMHLQDENRLLRRQLRETRSTSRGHMQKVARSHSATPCRRRRMSDVSRNRGSFSRQPFVSPAPTVAIVPRVAPSQEEEKIVAQISSPDTEQRTELRHSTVREPSSEIVSPRLQGQPMRKPSPLEELEVCHAPGGLETVSPSTVASKPASFRSPLRLDHMERPPPEGDLDGFLRYLDAFQARAECLCVAQPPT